MHKSHSIAGLSVFVAFLACGGDDGGSTGSSSLENTCARICARLKGANCSGDDPNTCMSTCTTNATAVPSACTGQSNALLTCASKATFTCDADREGQPIGCDSQTAARVSCITSNSLDAGTLPRGDAGPGPIARSDASISPIGRDAGSIELGSDAGISITGDGGAQQCAAKDPANVCQVCGSKNCCAEISACDADCQALIDCTVVCDNGDPADSDACYDDCSYEATQDAVDNYNGLFTCLEDSCEAQCF